MDRWCSMTNCEGMTICFVHIFLKIEIRTQKAVVLFPTPNPCVSMLVRLPSYNYRNRVVEDMRNLDRMKDEYAGIQIPVAVLK